MPLLDNQLKSVSPLVLPAQSRRALPAFWRHHRLPRVAASFAAAVLLFSAPPCCPPLRSATPLSEAEAVDLVKDCFASAVRPLLPAWVLDARLAWALGAYRRAGTGASPHHTRFAGGARHIHGRQSADSDH